MAALSHSLLRISASTKDMTQVDTRADELTELIRQIRGARPNPKKLKALLEKYEREFGFEAEKQALDIIAKTTTRAWSELAEGRESRGIDDLLDMLWGSFEQAGGVFTVERTEDSAQIHCTRCPIADSYLSIGKPKYGLIFHCSTDPHIVAGFNPEIEFRVTKRLMSGDDCCDHYYRLRRCTATIIRVFREPRCINRFTSGKFSTRRPYSSLTILRKPRKEMVAGVDLNNRFQDHEPCGIVCWRPVP